MIGWGPYSAESSILAASVPEAPPQPIFNSFIAANQTLVIDILQS